MKLEEYMKTLKWYEGSDSFYDSCGLTDFSRKPIIVEFRDNIYKIIGDMNYSLGECACCKDYSLFDYDYDTQKSNIVRWAYLFEE